MERNKSGTLAVTPQLHKRATHLAAAAAILRLFSSPTRHAVRRFLLLCSSPVGELAVAIVGRSTRGCTRCISQPPPPSSASSRRPPATPSRAFSSSIPLPSASSPSPSSRGARGVAPLMRSAQLRFVMEAAGKQAAALCAFPSSGRAPSSSAVLEAAATWCSVGEAQSPPHWRRTMSSMKKFVEVTANDLQNAECPNKEDVCCSCLVVFASAAWLVVVRPILPALGGGYPGPEQSMDLHGPGHMFMKWMNVCFWQNEGARRAYY